MKDGQREWNMSQIGVHDLEFPKIEKVVHRKKDNGATISKGQVTYNSFLSVCEEYSIWCQTYL